MKKKHVWISLLVIGILSGVGMQIQAKDTTYICGNGYSPIWEATKQCMHKAEKQSSTQVEDTKNTQTAVENIMPLDCPYHKTCDGTHAHRQYHVNSSTSKEENQAATSQCPYHKNCNGLHHHNNCEGSMKRMRQHTNGYRRGCSQAKI